MVRQDDAVDGFIAQWTRERPELDTRPMSVIGRLHRAGAILDAGLRPVFAAAGLGNGDADVIFSLRRAGAPYELSPSQLAASVMVTSGAVTKRVDRLERDGLVTRTVCADDGRGRRIRLTEGGLDLADTLIVDHWDNEARLLRGLSVGEQDQLAGLLRKLLLDIDDR